MKNVSIKKRARKNNNNKKYNKTQTKRSRRNKTQRINRRRRNFRNKTRRGGGTHGPSRLSEGINADGSAARRVPGYRTARKSSRAPTNSNASIAARALNPLASASAPFSRQQRRNPGPGALYMASRMASSRQQSYDPREIDVEEVQEDISREIQLMTDKIGKEFLKIEKLEEENKELQGEINGKQYLEASAEGKGIINARVGQQVGENYSEIARKKREIVNLERLIKGNEDAMKKLAKNIANIINTSKIHKDEYKANMPHGILMKQMIERGPGEKDTWRFFLIKKFPGLAHYFYNHP